MVGFLLDENISNALVSQVALHHPEIPIVSLHHWRNGVAIGDEDETVLQLASEDALSLVTYDLRTIPDTLRIWGEAGRHHSGVFFIDERTIANNDFGKLVAGIATTWSTYRDIDMTDRVVFINLDGL